MPQRGPKPLSSEALARRGARKDTIKRRKHEEAAQRRVTLLPRKATPPAPTGIGAQAKAFWKMAHAEFAIEPSHGPALRQATLALDVAEKSQALLMNDGLTVADPTSGKVTPHPLVKTCAEARHQFISISKILGFFE